MILIIYSELYIDYIVGINTILTEVFKLVLSV